MIDIDIVHILHIVHMVFMNHDRQAKSIAIKGKNMPMGTKTCAMVIGAIN